MVHRLGAYNVIRVLAGEYNMHDYGGLGLEFWQDLGRLSDRHHRPRCRGCQKYVGQPGRLDFAGP